MSFDARTTELLLEMFKYLNLQFVYDGFFGLNQRFNSLVASNLLPLNIATIQLFSWKNYSYQTFVNFFARRIIKLIVEIYQSEYIYDLFNFPNVRLLTPENPSDEDCE
jgi:hypothetical protein